MVDGLSRSLDMDDDVPWVLHSNREVAADVIVDLTILLLSFVVVKCELVQHYHSQVLLKERE